MNRAYEKLCNYTQQCPVTFGVGSIATVKDAMGMLGAKKLFVVYDQGVKMSGLAEKVTKSLDEQGVDYITYDDITAEPVEDVVDKAYEVAKEAGCDGVLGLGGGSPMDTAKIISVLLKKGGSLGDLYSTADLRRDSRGNIYVDADGKVVGNTTNVKDIKLGSVFPKANLAWRNDFNYGNFNFGFMLSARLGGIVYSATQAYMDYYGVSEATAAARDFGGVVVNGDLIDAENWYSVVAGQGGLPQYYTYSATNFRLQEVSIGYTIPKAKLWNIADVTVSLVGRNLWMIYCEAPFDPEAVATTGNYYQGIDNFMMPGTRNLGFNVRLKF